ncbi:MAG: hypothetical protein CMO32_23830 [Variovorax sp.]|jgi:hypothetical protein|nr:hypothetical protein [Variovorax sp.]
MNMTGLPSLPLELLERVLPGAKLLPDSILQAADRREIAYEFVLVTDWPDLDAPDAKLQLFDLVFAGKSFPEGDVVVVTDESFRSGQPIQCQGGELRRTLDRSPQFVFDGDVIFLWREIAALSVFHHEGGFAHIGW